MQESIATEDLIRKSNCLKIVMIASSFRQLAQLYKASSLPEITVTLHSQNHLAKVAVIERMGALNNAVVRVIRGHTAVILTFRCVEISLIARSRSRIIMMEAFIVLAITFTLLLSASLGCLSFGGLKHYQSFMAQISGKAGRRKQTSPATISHPIIFQDSNIQNQQSMFDNVRQDNEASEDPREQPLLK